MPVLLLQLIIVEGGIGMVGLLVRGSRWLR